MVIGPAHPNQTKLRRSDRPPRWGCKSYGRVAGDNPAAPMALDALPAERAGKGGNAYYAIHLGRILKMKRWGT